VQYSPTARAEGLSKEKIKTEAIIKKAERRANFNNLSLDINFIEKAALYNFRSLEE
jgi:hypothetical protein